MKRPDIERLGALADTIKGFERWYEDGRDGYKVGLYPFPAAEFRQAASAELFAAIPALIAYVRELENWQTETLKVLDEAEASLRIVGGFKGHIAHIIERARRKVLKADDKEGTS